VHVEIVVLRVKEQKKLEKFVTACCCSLDFCSGLNDINFAVIACHFFAGVGFSRLFNFEYMYFFNFFALQP